MICFGSAMLGFAFNGSGWFRLGLMMAFLLLFMLMVTLVVIIFLLGLRCVVFRCLCLTA